MKQTTESRAFNGMRLPLIALAIAATVAVFLSFGLARPALAADDDANKNLNAGSLVTQGSPTTQGGLATQGNLATQATKASAFEYKVGRYVDGRENVQKSKIWFGTKMVDNLKVTRKKGNGPEFAESWTGGSGGVAYGGGGPGYNCGYGVYITGYKGPADADVVVPNKIGGKPVVCVTLRSDAILGSTMKSLDVSKCKSLKALSIGSQVQTGCTIDEIIFGKNPKLAHFNLSRSTVTKKLDIKPANLRVLHIWGSNLANGFTFDTPKALELAFTDVSKLSVNGIHHLKVLYVGGCKNCKIALGKMPNLKKLDVSHCNLKTLDISKNKKLKMLSASGNSFNKKTTAALKKWQKAGKGRTLRL